MGELLKENSKAEQLRKGLKDLFKDTPFVDDLVRLDDETLERVADGMKDGVYFGSPVFDGSKEERDQVTVGTKAACRLRARLISTTA